MWNEKKILFYIHSTTSTAIYPYIKHVYSTAKYYPNFQYIFLFKVIRQKLIKPLVTAFSLHAHASRTIYSTHMRYALNTPHHNGFVVMTSTRVVHMCIRYFFCWAPAMIDFSAWCYVFAAYRIYNVYIYVFI